MERPLRLSVPLEGMWPVFMHVSHSEVGMASVRIRYCDGVMAYISVRPTKGCEVFMGVSLTEGDVANAPAMKIEIIII